MFCKITQQERQSYKQGAAIIKCNARLPDLFHVPVLAFPDDAFGVNGAHKELKHELPVAHTEKDVAGSGSYISGLSILVLVIYKKSRVINGTYKCRRSEAEAENH